MKDHNDKDTIGYIHALDKRPIGRPRLYKSAAEKQRAYRDRVKEQTYGYDEITDQVKMQIQKIQITARKASDEQKVLHLAEAKGAYALWLSIVGDRFKEHDQNVILAKLEHF